MSAERDTQVDPVQLRRYTSQASPLHDQGFNATSGRRPPVHGKVDFFLL